MFSTESDDLRVVELLLGADADPNGQNESDASSLMLGAVNAQEAIVRRLLAADADAAARDSAGNDAADAAEHGGSARLAELLRSHSVNATAASQSVRSIADTAMNCSHAESSDGARIVRTGGKTNITQYDHAQIPPTHAALTRPPSAIEKIDTRRCCHLLRRRTRAR
jgi:ankyrin repeat protein